MMEDAATAEISRSQIWQWVQPRRVALRDGRTVTRELVRQILDEETAKIRETVGEETWRAGRPDETREIFEQVALSEELMEFLTCRLRVPGSSRRPTAPSGTIHDSRRSTAGAPAPAIISTSSTLQPITSSEDIALAPGETDGRGADREVLRRDHLREHAAGAVGGRQQRRRQPGLVARPRPEGPRTASSSTCRSPSPRSRTSRSAATGRRRTRPRRRPRCRA